MQNAFEKRVAESKSVTTKQSSGNTLLSYFEKNGMVVGGASLALGVMMMGGTYFMENSGLKAELTDGQTPAPTTTSISSVESSKRVSSESLQPTPTSTSSPSAESSATASSESSQPTTADASSSTSSTSGAAVQTEVVTLSTEPLATTSSEMVVENAPMALSAPAPQDENLSVPSELLQIDESDLAQALDQKAPELLMPAEQLGE